MSRSKTVQHTILIVCEGSNTEPNYFKGIRDEVIANKLWTEGISIDIRPKPKLDEEEAEPVQSPHKSQRRKRPLKQVNTPVPMADIENEYQAVPLRYVREAQKCLEDGTYDEAWAVFDQDGHPRHLEAFELAETLVDGKRVDIAFSSISFEHWVLLHFEKNTTAFVKSACKEDKKELKCGSGAHQNDCYGGRCVSGYLRAHSYVTDYSKQANMDLYASLKKLTPQALENAAWLRTQITGAPIYSLNPYSDVDVLVKRLLKIEKEYIWLSFDTPWELGGIEIEMSHQNNGGFTLTITNRKSIGFIFNKTGVIYSSEEVLEEIEIQLRIIEPGELRREVFIINPDILEMADLELRIDFDEKHTLIFSLN